MAMRLSASSHRTLRPARWIERGLCAPTRKLRSTRAAAASMLWRTLSARLLNRDRKGASAPTRELLRFLLLLLADADLESLLLGFLERLVIVTRHGIGEIPVHIGVLGQHRHDGESLVAGGAERPEPFHVWNCHTHPEYHRHCAG